YTFKQTTNKARNKVDPLAKVNLLCISCHPLRIDKIWRNHYMSESPQALSCPLVFIILEPIFRAISSGQTILIL
ncbi:MAG: hypothetical protein OCC45_11300, partial [Desulfotalea sp.]